MVILDCWNHTILIKPKSSSAIEKDLAGTAGTKSTHLIRPPTPNCHCSCHRSSESFFLSKNPPHYHPHSIGRQTDRTSAGFYSTLSTLYDCQHHYHHSPAQQHLYSSVQKNPKLNKNISYSIGREDESELYSGSSSYFHAYPQQPQRFKYRQESNYSDISLNVYEPADKYNKQNNNSNIITDASISSPYYQQTRTSFKHHFKGINILYLLKLDPFKFATMEPIQIDNKIIVFSLVDTFTKLSPNKILENYIKKLLEEGKTSITIFNLSEPLQYMKNALNVPICEYGWPEKLAPSLEKLCSLCKSIDSWLNVDRNRNIAIIYSKRDLSRASLAIAVFLQYIKICLGNDSIFDYESMYNYYHFNIEKYLQPSQKRYISYFTSLLNGDSTITNQKFHLKQIVLRKIPNFDGNGLCKPFIKVYQGLNLVFSSQIINIDNEFTKQWDYIVFDVKPPLKLRGEILIKCYHKVISPNSRTEMFSFQFHTGTLTDNVVTFNKNEIDIALYDKRFHDDTCIELIFNDAFSEKAQQVDLIEDNQITKCNSYENFYPEAANLEYTKGPLDGSLYATVSKKPTAYEPSNEESILDELMNEIFTEIKSFPDILTPNLKQNDYDYVALSKNSTTDSKFWDKNIDQLICDQHSVLQDSNDELEELDWLQKQQLKLKNKQNKKEFVEKRLINELKSTIVNNNYKTMAGIPEVPIRTSSRNIIPKLIPENEFSSDTLSSHGNELSDLSDYQITYGQRINNSNDQTDHGQIADLTESKLTMRSTTPAFPVRQQQERTIKHQKDKSQTNGVTLFFKDTSAYWYKPNISREDAIKYLHDKPPGTFIIRNSNSFPNAYGLAVKVWPLGDSKSNFDPVRHFLIESTNKGVQIKGCAEEPVFSSLAALVYQHSITRISLPIVLIIPSSDIENGNDNDNYFKRFYDNGAACNVLYFTSQDVELLTGPSAVKKVIDQMLHNKEKIQPAIIHFKASIKGITLTDNFHRLFFRQHYQLKSISYCSIDPSNRSWQYNSGQNKIQSHLFGFVTRKKNSNTENTCFIFGHFEPDQPSHAIVDFVNKLIKAKL